jgi:hypothetical protein
VLIIASTVLVDVDHYIYYVFKKKNFSLIKAYKWYQSNRIKSHHLSREEKRKIYFGFHFLHGVEILAIIYFLYAYASSLFLYVLIGYSLHFFADLIVEGIWCGTIDKVSVIYNFLKGRKLKFIDDVDFPSKTPLILHA